MTEKPDDHSPDENGNSTPSQGKQADSALGNGTPDVTKPGLLDVPQFSPSIMREMPDVTKPGLLDVPQFSPSILRTVREMPDRDAPDMPHILPGLLRIDAPLTEPETTAPQRLTVPLNGELQQGKGNPPGETAKLQEMLKELGYGKLLGKFGPAKDGVDDDYGPSTASAVRAFQQVNGLAPTGQLDKETARLMSEQREQLAQTLAGAQVTEISVKPADLAGPSGLFNSIGIKPADIAPPVQAVALSTASIVSELSATLASFGDEDGRPVADRLDTNAPQQRRPQNGMPSP